MNNTIENLLILGGGERDMLVRVKKSLELYRRNPVPIILTGSHSGMDGRELPKGRTRECEFMAKHLLNEKVPHRDIYLEDKALDTLGNVFFSLPLIKDGSKTVGIITDYFQMERGLWIFNKVIPNLWGIPIYSSMNDNKIELVTQKARLYALMLDLRNIKAGNLQGISDYMEDKHPFYSKNPKFSWMGLLTEIESKRRALIS